MIATGELQLITQLDEGLAVPGPRKSMGDRVDLFGDLLGRHVLGVEVCRGPEIHAQLLSPLSDEDAAVEDEGQARPAPVAAERATQLKPIHPRHPDVRHDGLDGLALEELEGGRAVGCREDLVTGLAEQGGQQTSAGQGIIDDQNAHRWSASEQVLCQTLRCVT